MPHLFDELTIRGVTLRNRIGVTPMCMFSSDDGMPNDWHMVHLGSRAVGGAALVILEATAVEPRGRISPQDLGIWSDAHVEPLIPITKFISDHGTVPGIQLAHAGRKAGTSVPWEGNVPLPDEDGGWQPVAPSPIPFHQGYRRPSELNREDITDVIAAFRDGARRAREAGMRWLEYHAAHGYLLHQFLSPLSNIREDEYGGSFEGRIRMTVEVTQAIREEWPEEYPLSARLSATDWVEGGWTVEETVELSRILKNEGVDVIDASSGGSSRQQKIPLGPGYQVPFSEAVRRGADMTTATVGLISEPSHADEIIRNDRADIVLLGREVLRDPYWPQHAAKILRQPDAVPIPPQYALAHR